ncbi:GAF domain-containing protein [Paraburkholderia dinghuensis]|uniref:GAF domain-containing protein n=2 Tax=Paraburkholderia dinghuensis TaxID=2305225 RepID=A0A3N6NIQ1_9BURK|nr:GAF domain-containing protein [Paraburkholderia dinghuensis]
MAGQAGDSPRQVIRDSDFNGSHKLSPTSGRTRTTNTVSRCVRWWCVGVWRHRVIDVGDCVGRYSAFSVGVAGMGTLQSATENGKAGICSPEQMEIGARFASASNQLPVASGGEQAISEPAVMRGLDGAQRSLRDSLLRQGGLVRADLRDLAAHLLLYLDEPAELLTVVLEWLTDRLNADRADAGLIAFGSHGYQPMKECIRPAFASMPSVIGTNFDLSDPTLELSIASRIPVVIDDVATDWRVSAPVRIQLGNAGVQRKLTMALRPVGRSVGLVCLDRGMGAPAWSPTAVETFAAVVGQILNPILRPITEGSEIQLPSTTPAPQAVALTSAEKRVAQLVLSGCSYKEIANRLGRAPSTIDHQLRGLREKLAVNSTPKLITALQKLGSQLFDAQD